MKPIVTQEPEKPIAVEILASSITTISEAMKKLRGSRLNDRALLVLLRDATNLPMADIRKVLASLDDLERMYCRPRRA